ncbi:MAG: hypothetical protein ABIV50_15685 [Opitutus sp.]
MRGFQQSLFPPDTPPTAQTFLGRDWWSQFTRDNARFLRSSHVLTAAGAHTLKITMVDPGIVLQKILIADSSVPESYFGPPQYETVK